MLFPFNHRSTEAALLGPLVHHATQALGRSIAADESVIAVGW
jgi:hypothetical protein